VPELRASPRGAEPRVPFGIPQIDEMLDGGLVPHRPYLIVGPAGTGKTTLALEFLREGIRRGEPGLYVTVEDPPNEVRYDHQALRPELDRIDVFDAIPDVMRYEHIPFKDISSVRDVVPFGKVPDEIRQTPEFTSVEVTISALEQLLRTEVQRQGYLRLVIDSLTALQYFCMKGIEPMAGAQAFLRFLSSLRTTTLLTVESPLEDVESAERSLARGEIRLFRWELEGATVRAIGVEKFRGSSHDVRLHPYRIGPLGVDINLDLTISRDTRRLVEPALAVLAPALVEATLLSVPGPTPGFLGSVSEEVRDLVTLGVDVAPIRAEVEAALSAIQVGRPADSAVHVARISSLTISLAGSLLLAPPAERGLTKEARDAFQRIAQRADAARGGVPPTRLPEIEGLIEHLRSVLALLPPPVPAAPLRPVSPEAAAVAASKTLVGIPAREGPAPGLEVPISPAAATTSPQAPAPATPGPEEVRPVEESIPHPGPVGPPIGPTVSSPPSGLSVRASEGVSPSVESPLKGPTPSPAPGSPSGAPPSTLPGTVPEPSIPGFPARESLVAPAVGPGPSAGVTAEVPSLSAVASPPRHETVSGAPAVGDASRASAPAGGGRAPKQVAGSPRHPTPTLVDGEPMPRFAPRPTRSRSAIPEPPVPGSGEHGSLARETVPPSRPVGGVRAASSAPGSRFAPATPVDGAATTSTRVSPVRPLAEPPPLPTLTVPGVPGQERAPSAGTPPTATAGTAPKVGPPATAVTPARGAARPATVVRHRSGAGATTPSAPPRKRRASTSKRPSAPPPAEVGPVEGPSLELTPARAPAPTTRRRPSRKRKAPTVVAAMPETNPSSESAGAASAEPSAPVVETPPDATPSRSATEPPPTPSEAPP